MGQKKIVGSAQTKSLRTFLFLQFRPVPLMTLGRWSCLWRRRWQWARSGHKTKCFWGLLFPCLEQRSPCRQIKTISFEVGAIHTWFGPFSNPPPPSSAQYQNDRATRPVNGNDGLCQRHTVSFGWCQAGTLAALYHCRHPQDLRKSKIWMNL